MKQILIIALVILVSVTVGCAYKTVPANNSRDYEEGLKYGDEAARYDAFSNPCTAAGELAWYPLSRLHLKALKTSGKSNDFMAGFLEAFEQHYGDYQRQYCED
ncbi:MAG: hypothetical protein V1793_10065 [Pseudomonadota bacterium]